MWGLSAFIVTWQGSICKLFHLCDGGQPYYFVCSVECLQSSLLNSFAVFFFCLVGSLFAETYLLWFIFCEAVHRCMRTDLAYFLKYAFHWQCFGPIACFALAFYSASAFFKHRFLFVKCILFSLLVAEHKELLLTIGNASFCLQWWGGRVRRLWQVGFFNLKYRRSGMFEMYLTFILFFELFVAQAMSEAFKTALKNSVTFSVLLEI